MECRLHSCLYSWRLVLKKCVELNQTHQKDTHDTHAAEEEYVWGENCQKLDTWEQNKVVTRHYTGEHRSSLNSNWTSRRNYKRHNDHMQARLENKTVLESASRELDSSAETGVPESGVSDSNDTVQQTPLQNRAYVTSYPKRNRKPRKEGCSNLGCYCVS